MITEAAMAELRYMYLRPGVQGEASIIRDLLREVEQLRNVQRKIVTRISYQSAVFWRDSALPGHEEDAAFAGLLARTVEEIGLIMADGDHDPKETP